MIDMRRVESKGRIQSAAIWASCFLALSVLIAVAAQFMGLVGDFVSEAMILGSPLNWLDEPTLYLLRVSRGTLMYPFVFAPYACLGWLFGHYAAFRDISLRRLLLAMLLRFAMVWIPIVVIGVWRYYRIN